LKEKQSENWRCKPSHKSVSLGEKYTSTSKGEEQMDNAIQKSAAMSIPSFFNRMLRNVSSTSVEENDPKDTVVTATGKDPDMELLKKAKRLLSDDLSKPVSFRKLWQKPIIDTFAYYNDVSKKIHYNMVMAIDKDGFAYTCGDTLQRIDTRTGENLWSVRLQESISGIFPITPPIANEKFVFAGNGENTVFALDKNTGEIKWQRKRDDFLLDGRSFPEGEPHLALSNDGRTLYLATKTGTVMFLDSETGDVKGEPAFSDQKDKKYHSRILVDKNGSVIVQAATDNDSKRTSMIVSLSGDKGKENWRWESSERTPWWSKALLIGDQLITGNDRGHTSMDISTGKINWESPCSTISRNAKIGDKYRIINLEDNSGISASYSNTGGDLWKFSAKNLPAKDGEKSWAGCIKQIEKCRDDFFIIWPHCKNITALSTSSGKVMGEIPVKMSHEDLIFRVSPDGKTVLFQGENGKENMLQAYEILLSSEEKEKLLSGEYDEPEEDNSKKIIRGENEVTIGGVTLPVNCHLGSLKSFKTKPKKTFK
jgi:outer membrane protein assembly factor BamB